MMITTKMMPTTMSILMAMMNDNNADNDDIDDDKHEHEHDNDDEDGYGHDAWRCDDDDHDDNRRYLFYCWTATIVMLQCVCTVHSIRHSTLLLHQLGRGP